MLVPVIEPTAPFTASPAAWSFDAPADSRDSIFAWRSAASFLRYASSELLSGRCEHRWMTRLLGSRGGGRSARQSEYELAVGVQRGWLTPVAAADMLAV